MNSVRPRFAYEPAPISPHTPWHASTPSSFSSVAAPAWLSAALSCRVPLRFAAIAGSMRAMARKLRRFVDEETVELLPSAETEEEEAAASGSSPVGYSRMPSGRPLLAPSVLASCRMTSLPRARNSVTRRPGPLSTVMRTADNGGVVVALSAADDDDDDDDDDDAATVYSPA